MASDDCQGHPCGRFDFIRQFHFFYVESSKKNLFPRLYSKDLSIWSWQYFFKQCIKKLDEKKKNIIKAQCRLSTWPIIQTGLPRLMLETRKKGHHAVSSVCFVVSRLMLWPDPINFNVLWCARVLPLLWHKISIKSNDLSSALTSCLVLFLRPFLRGETFSSWTVDR